MITIDLRMINSSGIGTYGRNLVPLVIAALPRHDFTLLARSSELDAYPWATANNISIIDMSSPVYTVSEQFELVRKIPKETVLFWSPHYNIPVLYRRKLLVTIHDAFHLAMPEYTGGLLKRVYAKLMFAAVVKKAKAILCVSRFTAVELTRLTGISAEKLSVILLGANESWYHIKKLQRPESKPYLLYVGNVKPHKNLSSLVAAFEMIADVIPHDLLIVGKKDDLITADKDVEYRASGLGNRVRFTGLVEEELLQQYFVHADALVFPSLYEGFGLPPLEAMACGCPVIVSNSASLPEVCGDAVIYCNPEDPSDIAEKIRLVVLDENNLRETMRQNGIEQAKKFTWEKCARETVSVIEKVLGQ